MNYKNIYEAEFISRPNRFIAVVKVEDREETVHVKNTGRCKELLIPGCKVLLEKSDNPNRKTAYDLVSVYKKDVLFNMDSQMPNKIFQEGVKTGVINIEGFSKDDYLKGEVTYLNSRFDFYMENENKKAFIEVKGVTLEENNIAMFPDAPTVRGIKHINELIKAKEEGYDVFLALILQFSGANYFTPNPKDKAFCEAMKKARDNGVKILAYECNVQECSVTATGEIKVDF